MLMSHEFDDYVIPPSEQRRRAREVKARFAPPAFAPRPVVVAAPAEVVTPLPESVAVVAEVAPPKPLTYVELVRLSTPVQPWRGPAISPAERPSVADANLPTMAEIAAVVTKATGFTMADIKSERRSASLVSARHLLVWMLRALTPASTPRIGRFIGGRDHTTIVHAVQKMRALIERDDAIRAEIALLEDEVRAVVAKRREATAGEGGE